MPADRPVIALRTLGCKVNRTESESLADVLGSAADVVMDSDLSADVVVINTCTVTAEADAKARKAIRRALADGARTVVVTGCLAAIDPDGLRALDPRVVVEADRDRIAARVAKAAGLGRRWRDAVATVQHEPGRTRVMVKVQDGCDRRCSYCIVPDARGVPRSVRTAEVLSRVRALAQAGVPEIVLTGVNIGRYQDPEGASDLAALVTGVALTPIPRVRISSIEPLDLDRRTLATLSGIGKVVPHLHIPLQSGCDRTLLAMGRGYTVKDFERVLSAARDALPGLTVTTDVIAGFPGESDADFRKSLAFVRRAGFARMHVFRYSARAGTPAAARDDRIASAIVAQRAASMREASDKMVLAHMRARVGTSTRAVIERVSSGRARGTADDSLTVEMLAAGLEPGQIVRVGIDGTGGRGYRGTVLESE